MSAPWDHYPEDYFCVPADHPAWAERETVKPYCLTYADADGAPVLTRRFAKRSAAEFALGVERTLLELNPALLPIGCVAVALTEEAA